MSLASLFLLMSASAPLAGPPSAALALAPADPAVVSSTIETVTVYPGSAMVTRRGTVTGPGSYVFPGLPLALVPDSVRVRTADGARLEVLGVEARERFVRAVEDERMAALAVQRDALRAELAVLQDEQRVQRDLEQHLVRLLEPDAASGVEGQPAVADLGAWKASAEFLGAELSEVGRALRTTQVDLDAVEARLKALEEEYTLGRRGVGHQVRDVLVELDGPEGGAGGPLELEYLIRGAGWVPVYDLRVAASLDQVELVHRAEVRQETGEDWNDVELLLSTAQPEVGAAPPALAAIWLGLSQPIAFEASRRGLAASGYVDRHLEADTALFYFDEAGFDPSMHFAAVLTGGSSLRYRVARAETLESRPDPTRVLIGRAGLDVEAERFCAPALDEHVWLRGRATNDSPWVLLPGAASVYFGGDFVGQSQLDQVRLGEEFDLHLGLDPMVTFERIELERKQGSSGFFGTRKRVTDGWRLRFENHGAAGSEPGGAVRVFVREVLPRSTDERLDVELEDANPAVSRDERWARDREEAGILTWDLSVPRGVPATIEWTTSLTFPEDLELAW